MVPVRRRFTGSDSDVRGACAMRQGRRTSPEIQTRRRGQLRRTIAERSHTSAIRGKILSGSCVVTVAVARRYYCNSLVMSYRTGTTTVYNTNTEASFSQTGTSLFLSDQNSCNPSRFSSFIMNSDQMLSPRATTEPWNWSGRPGSGGPGFPADTFFSHQLTSPMKGDISQL